MHVRKVEFVNKEVKEDKPVVNTNDGFKKKTNVKSEENKEIKEAILVEENKEEEKTKEVEDKGVEETKETEESTAELIERIRHEVDSYFGNENMKKVTFLINKANLNNGQLLLSVIFFTHMISILNTAWDVVVKAVKLMELIELSKYKKLRRSIKCSLPNYDEEYKMAQKAKTVYVKGFPLKGINIQKLHTHFNQYEPHQNIIMRIYQDNNMAIHFKGSILVEFKTLDDAKAFMKRKSVKYNDVELIRKWATDCIVGWKSKNKERKEHLIRKISVK